MYANTRNKLLPAAFATSDKDEKIPEPTVVPTPSAITAPSPSLRARSEERRVGKEGRSRWSPNN